VTVGDLADERRLPADFSDLYRAEVRPLLLVARSLTRSDEVAKEVVHEAFLRALGQWDRVSSLDRPGAWLRRVALNLAIDMGRRSRREQRAMSRVALAVTGASEVVRPADFWELVRRLPQRQQEVVALRYVEDMTVDEIAATLSVSAGTVKASLFSARQTLAKVLGAEEVIDEER
jgi:RNA polymerase sigma-70 factor (ECF subfamily)